MKRTPLYGRHIQLGARIVPFGGWDMPVQYSGVLKEHKAVRENAGLFDVSHMGEFFVSGGDALPFVNSVVTNDVSSLSDGQILYTVMCNRSGGTVDDLLVYRMDAENFMLVVNAGNIEKDFEWISGLLTGGENVSLTNRSDEFALLALQGPEAVKIFGKLGAIPDSLRYYHFCDTSMAGIPVTTSRTGYTGEDGLEILLPAGKAEEAWNAIMEAGEAYGILPCGLAARDLLRIEAGYCLYGHELDEKTDPISAGLKWVVKMDAGDFVGKDVLAGLKPAKRRIGFVMDGRAVPREGYAISSESGLSGNVTSGTFSPVLQKPIGIGYISLEPEKAPKVGDRLSVEIRGKSEPAVICRMPFIETRTFK